jgi:hypothetical protein
MNDQDRAAAARHGIESPSSSVLPDSFLTFSDTDTRMLTLLGLEPAANPNDGEEHEDWRQLTGFQGLGDRRRNQEAQALAAPDGTSTLRNTRVSWELHNNAFENMWSQLGGLNLHLQEAEPPRAEPLQRHGSSNSSASNQEGRGQPE